MGGGDYPKIVKIPKNLSKIPEILPKILTESLKSQTAPNVATNKK
jgi:hypothetical protein